MNGGGWAWIGGWLAAAILIPATLNYAVTRHRRARAQAAARDARDAMFCASIGVDWRTDATWGRS